MKFVNTNSHAVRVENPDRAGKLQRLRAGGVVEAEGAYADALAAVPGVQKATSAQVKSFEAEQEANAQQTGQTRGIVAKAAAAIPRLLVRALSAGPNRIVIGDDSAPYAPPTGVVTTKAAMAEKDDAHRQAFAQGERLPGDEPPGASEQPLVASGDFGQQSSVDIEAQQAKNAEAAEHVAEALIDGDPGAVFDLGLPEDGDGNGESASTPASSSSGSSEDEGAYADHSFQGLQAEAKERGVSAGGSRADIVARLEADDEAKAAA